MRLSMEGAGFLPASDIGEADIIIYNTCSVRQHAEDRVLGRIRSVPNRDKRTLVVAGCMAQRLGGSLSEENTADLVLGPYRDPDVGIHLLDYYRTGERGAHLSMERKDFAPRLDTGLADGSWHAWVTITHGCENYCAYCIVPYVRGKLISFPREKIIEHIRILADSGTREITLLGQNVNQYGQDNGEVPFSRLLEEAAGVPGMEKINFLTSHPADFDPDIVRVMADHENITRAIHLPLQSGSDRVLAAMNRGYTLSGYKKIIDTIRSRIPDVSLSTDLIVGFPGEQEDDYRATLDAVREIGYEEAFTFAYSPREGTPAFRLPEELTREEKVNRLRGLIDLHRDLAVQKMGQRIGSRDRAVLERTSPRNSDELLGRTFHNLPLVLAGGEEYLRRIVPVEITGIRGATLQGRPLA
jgi:tRNA-2-methylthio-N6-dimethylallyladenosine synthase